VLRIFFFRLVLPVRVEAHFSSSRASPFVRLRAGPVYLGPLRASKCLDYAPPPSVSLGDGHCAGFSPIVDLFFPVTVASATTFPWTRRGASDSFFPPPAFPPRLQLFLFFFLFPIFNVRRSTFFPPRLGAASLLEHFLPHRGHTESLDSPSLPGVFPPARSRSVHGSNSPNPFFLPWPDFQL